MSSPEVRLIDANALKNEMQRVVIDITDTPAPDEYTSKLVAMLAKVFQKKIDEAPAVDAEPVRHGRWIENIAEDARAYPPYSYKSGYKCSLCGREERTNKEPYCHCGAKMDAEVQNGTE